MTRKSTFTETQHATALQSSLSLARDPKKAIQEMMETIDALRAVYQQETEALESTDSKVFISLQNNKLDIAARYEAGVRELMTRRQELKDVDPALKAELQKMQDEFSTLAARNISALKRMQRCTERLGNTLRKAARDAMNRQGGYSYGETGKMETNERKTISIGISETA